MMAVHLVDGDRGGVGKSTWAIALTEYLLARGKAPVVVDCDMRNGDVHDVFHGSPVPVYAVNLRVREGWAELATFLESCESLDVVISLPANVGAEVSEQARFLRDTLTELGRSLTVWWVMNRSPYSVSLLIPVMDAFATSANMIAVRNLFFGPGEKFTRWNQSNTKKLFIEAGGQEIDLPELLDGIVDVTLAAKKPVRCEGADMSYGLRMMYRQWRDKLYESLDRLSEYNKVGVR